MYCFRFQPYYSTRRGKDKAGSMVSWNDRDFQLLPPLQTTARLTGLRLESDKLPITLITRINELGLLHVACVSADPDVTGTWPLEFDLRPHESDNEKQGQAAGSTDAGTGPEIDPEHMDRAQARITTLFSRPLDRRDKLTATNLLKSLERIIGMPKADWNYVLIRSLWPALHQCFSFRKESIEHEETWLILAGFLLRPGFGAENDPARVNELWQLHGDGLAYPGKRIQLQHISSGDECRGSQPRAPRGHFGPELPKLRAQRTRLPNSSGSRGLWRESARSSKRNSSNIFSGSPANLPRRSSIGALSGGVGLLLNRTPLYAGTENVVPAAEVEKAYDVLSDLDWTEPELAELQTLFLRAGRVVDNPNVDLPGRLREKIAVKLQKSGASPSRLARLRTFVPIAQVDRANLFGESLPPGLVIAGE